MTEKKQKTGLELLRAPFPANQISKLPKPTRRQTDEVKADFKAGARCESCGQWHHPKVVHLDYVGHAALTDRLLDCDPGWNWEPVATTEDGIPKFDSAGGMWIRLTVCGLTRLGYGHAENKKGGDAIKEIIGDAMRNAAMRFGAALDLWHKGDLHMVEDDDGNTADASPPKHRAIDNRPDNTNKNAPPPTEDPFRATNPSDDDKEATRIISIMGTITDMNEFKSFWDSLVESQPRIAKRPDVFAAKCDRKAVIGGKDGKAA